jgi:arsenite methyltransferase
MSGLATGPGFDVSPLRSYGLVETSKPGLTLSWVERGADALVNRGRIGKELAAALTSEAKRRADNNAFFGYMAWASMVAQKPR